MWARRAFVLEGLEKRELDCGVKAMKSVAIYLSLELKTRMMKVGVESEEQLPTGTARFGCPFSRCYPRLRRNETKSSPADKRVMGNTFVSGTMLFSHQ